MAYLFKAGSLVMFVALYLLLTSICGCDIDDSNLELDTETDLILAEDTSSGASDEYPDGPHGPWPGHIFPPIEMQDAWGQVVESHDVYQSASYWVVILSTPTCPPCSRLWDRREDIRIFMEANVDGSVRVDKVTGDLDSLTFGSVPVVMVVDLETMEILQRVDGSFQKFETFLEKLW